MNSKQEPLFLGFDFSTQQLKGVIIDHDMNIVCQSYVQYDTELPEFRTHNGVIQRGKVVTTPVLLWVKALDILLDKLSVSGADFSRVSALSGSAQQHGTVYWAVGAEQSLASLDPSHFLHTQLAACFSVSSSPVWLDSSTTPQCQSIEQLLGGPQELARITGSRAHERYSAAQIAKIFQTKPSTYKSTERISLVSSFACSLLLGKYAPIDWSDGSGMNLLDIRKKQWSQQCLDACAPELECKLGEAVPSDTIVGNISNYLVERFGFPEECKVIVFTGDNPSSLAGMGMKERDVAVSLGTSDTLFSWLKEPLTSLPLSSHVLINPVQPDEYMALLCFKNGSVTRQRLRDSHAGGSWHEFCRLLDQTVVGNHGYLGLFYDVEEVVPGVRGDYMYNSGGQQVSVMPSDAAAIRALVEGQMVARRAHTPVSLGKDTRIVATGGGSVNASLLQVMADVFKAPVHILESEHSAVLGAAVRAMVGLRGAGRVEEEPAGGEDEGRVGDQVETELSATSPCLADLYPTPATTLAASPNPAHAQMYDVMVERYKEVVNNILNDKTVTEEVKT